MKNSIFLLLSFIVFWPFSYSNKTEVNNTQIESQKIKELQDKITQTNDLIKSSNTEKSKILQNSSLLESQIQYRSELVHLIDKEKISLAVSLDSLTKINEKAIHDYSMYKETYFNLMRLKWMHKLSYNPLLQLLQSNNLENKVRKWYWIEQVEAKAKETYIQMNTILDSYFSKQKEINTKIQEKNNLINLQQNELAAIEKDKLSKTELLKDIDIKQKSLLAELEKYKTEKQKLTALISSIIKEDSEQNETLNNTGHVVKSNENWRFPLKRGIIISRFGINAESSNLKTKNDGIDIRSEDPFVSAATHGQVVQIKRLPNDLYMVLLRNENYYTVYSNLLSVLVKQDEWVEEGIKLGKCNGEGNAFNLHFEVWKGKTPINPQVFFN